MDTISCRVEIRTTPRYGRVLYSQVASPQWCVVFYEKPILVSLESVEPEEESFLRRASGESGLNLLDDFRFLKSFCKSSTASRSTVLECYTPPSLEVQSSPLLRSLVKVVDICKQFAWSATVSTETLRHVVLIKACNAHGFFSQSSSSAALYTYGSKMRHSCIPNVVYTSQRRGGMGSFVARRNIQAGEELFISYIDVFKSVPMRARELADIYLFTCDCYSCTEGVDRYRGIPCACGGTLFRSQATNIWSCSECDSLFTDESKLVSNEAESQLVEEGLEFLNSVNANSRSEILQLLGRLRGVLGEFHAITKIVEKAYIESQILVSMGCVKNQREELVSRTDAILGWTAYDPSFLDSSLVTIACALGRIGEFAPAIRYLEIVKVDMEQLFGTEEHNEALDLVNQALTACKDEDRPSVPDLV